MKTNLSQTGENVKPNEEKQCYDRDRQQRLQSIIGHFIKNNSDHRREDLTANMCALLGSDLRTLSDSAYEMRECISALLSFFLRPSVLAEFTEMASNSCAPVGTTLVRLLRFFYALDDSHIQAQIQLGALSQHTYPTDEIETLESYYE